MAIKHSNKQITLEKDNVIQPRHHQAQHTAIKTKNVLTYVNKSILENKRASFQPCSTDLVDL